MQKNIWREMLEERKNIFKEEKNRSEAEINLKIRKDEKTDKLEEEHQHNSDKGNSY